MDTDYQFQPISSNRSSKLPPSLPPREPDDNSQETLDLGWVFAVVRRRALVMLGVTLALSTLAGLAIVKSSRQIVKEYQGGFRILVEPVSAEGRLARLYLQAQSTNEGVADLSRIGSSVEETSLLDYQTQIRVLKSPKILEPVIEKLRAKYKDINYGNLVMRLGISRVTYEKDGKQAGTKILEVAFQDEDPKKIIFVLENQADYYQEYSRQERLTSLQQAINFIDSQLPELRQRVDKLQEELQKLREDSKLTVPDMVSRGLADQASSLAARRADIQTQLAESRKLYDNLKQQLDAGQMDWMITINPKAYEVLINQTKAVEAQLAIDSSLFLEDSTPIKSLREKQQNLRQTLRKEAEAALQNIADQIRQIEARARSIEESQEILNQRITQLPAVLRRFDDLQRELDVATVSLKLFLQKRESLQLNIAQQQVNWQIIAQPDVLRDETGLPMTITVKTTSRQLVIAVVLSVLLGIGVGFLVEVLNTVFHTPEEAKFATKLPLLGIIPRAKTLEKMIPITAESVAMPTPSAGGLNLVLGNVSTSSRTDSVSPEVVEAFRYLYTNIRLLNPQNPIRSFAIGSASIGDGKSTVAVNLAQTAAAIGQRVLLVDADLRCPKIHNKLGLPNVRGLSDAITTDMGLNDVIQRSQSVWSEQMPGEENLFVLTAGSLPPDPIKLLSSNKMLYLMEQFQAFFDLVIYDTPPLVGLADANIIAAHTDGMVLVVSMEKTDRSVLIKAMDSLKIAGASVLGLVANGVKNTASQSYAKGR